MPSIVDVLQRSRLAVLEAVDVETAQSEVRRYRQGQIPLWTWTAADGLHPASADDAGGVNIEPGVHAGNLPNALKGFSRLKNEAVLLVCDVDRHAAAKSLKTPFRQHLSGQVDQQDVVTWIVFLSSSEAQHERLHEVLGSLEVAPASLTATVAQPASAGQITHAAGVAVAAPTLDLDEIGDLEKFDRPEWTEYLNALPLAKLRELCERRTDLIEESVERIARLRENLKKILVHKEQIIDLMTWCSVAHLPMLLLGTWGTGKSMLVREFSKGLGIAPQKRQINSEDELVAELESDSGADGAASQGRSLRGRQRLMSGDVARGAARHFEYLVTRFTTPEELMGPVNIDLMLSHAIYLRQTHSLLPRAEIAFLDEVFKANSAILNSLLSIINERLFYNAGVPWTVNLVMLFGASNEPPQEEDLGAFFDRFPVRVLCDPVRNDQLRELLAAAQAQQYPGLAQSDPDLDEALRERQMQQRACVNDFRLLHKVAMFGFGGAELTNGDESEAFLGKYEQLLRNMRDEYDISDRSAAHFYRLARARALLEGRDELNRSDCAVLHYCGKHEDALRRLPTIVDELI